MFLASFLAALVIAVPPDPPVPDADKFLCVGKNYRQHLDELVKNDLLKEIPKEPTAFVKLNSCLVCHDTSPAGGSWTAPATGANSSVPITAGPSIRKAP